MTLGRAQVCLAARLARREFRRHPWRHALVVAMITVPVLATFVTFSAIDTVRDVEARQTGFEHAGADLTLSHPVPPAPADLEAIAADIGTGLESVESGWSGGDWLITGRERADGRGPVLVGAEVTDAAHGTHRGERFATDVGRLPVDDDEVFLTAPLAEAGGWAVGSSVSFARWDEPATVVGIGVAGDDVERPVAVVASRPDSYWTDVGSLDSFEAIDGGYISVHATAQTGIWLDDGATWTDVSKTFDSRAWSDSYDGFWSGSPAQVDARVKSGVALGSAALCAIVAVVASAAFAIASRRQLRAVGLLATAGADPSTIRLALVLQGALPGLIAGALAVTIGLGLAFAANARDVAVQRIWHVAGASIQVSTLGAVLAVALGVGAGMAAAWQPARTASRIPVLSALAGRRPIGPVSAKVPLLGVGLWVVGLIGIAVGTRMGSRSGVGQTLQPFVMIAAVAALALGGVGLAPPAIAVLGRVGNHVGGTLRMALRGLARHRTQSSATVAAVAVALALPVGLLAARGYQPNEVISPSATCGPTGTTTCIDSSPARTVLASSASPAVTIAGALRSEAARQTTADVLRAMGPSSTAIPTIVLQDGSGDYRLVSVLPDDAPAGLLTAWAEQAIAEGRAVALDPEAVPGTATFGEPDRIVTLDVVTSPDADPPWFPSGGQFLVGSSALEGLDEGRPADSLLVVRAEPMTPSVRAELDQLALDLDPWYFGPAVPTLAEIQAANGATPSSPTPVAQPEVWIGIDDPTGNDYCFGCDGRERGERLVLLWLAIGAGGVALLVLTVTLSLRSVDGAPDRRAALAAGAPPAQMRRQRALEGAILGLLGAGLAVPLGWLPIGAFRFAQDGARRRGESLLHTMSTAAPGWEVVPLLLIPVAVAVLGWLIVPALGALLQRGPRDELSPRW